MGMLGPPRGELPSFVPTILLAGTFNTLQEAAKVDRYPDSQDSPQSLDRGTASSVARTWRTWKGEMRSRDV